MEGLYLLRSAVVDSLYFILTLPDNDLDINLLTLGAGLLTFPQEVEHAAITGSVRTLLRDFDLPVLFLGLVTL